VFFFFFWDCFLFLLFIFLDLFVVVFQMVFLDFLMCAPGFFTIDAKVLCVVADAARGWGQQGVVVVLEVELARKGAGLVCRRH
jgi:hypothetical protein